MEPSVILKDRKNENGTRDFLVKWADGEEDSWVSHTDTGVQVCWNQGHGMHTTEHKQHLQGAIKLWLWLV